MSTRNYKSVIDETNAEKISKFLEQFECVVIRRVQNVIGNINDGTYSKIVEYAQSQEYKKNGTVSEALRCEWDRILHGVALKLRYVVGVTEDAYVFINASEKPDFFKKTQRLAKAFNQDSIIVKESETQDAYRLFCDGERVAVGKFISNITIPLSMDYWGGRGNMGKWCIDLVTKDIREELGF